MRAIAIYPKDESFAPTEEQVRRLMAYLEVMRVILPGGEGNDRTVGERPQNLGIEVISVPAELSVRFTDLDPQDGMEDWVEILSRRRFHIWVSQAGHDFVLDNPCRPGIERILGTEIDYVYCAV